jgi:hypothetical protein
MIAAGQNECLRFVQGEADKIPEWSDFTAYCRNRERGLRKNAFAELNRFIIVAKQWPLESRKSFVDWLCSCLAAFRESDGYGLAPQPLVTQIIEPTLKEWMTREILDSTPCRWAGMFFSGVAYGALRAGLANSTNAAEEHLREALRRNSADSLARVRLIELLLGDVEFNCHHLPEYYIGEPNDDMVRLNEARDLLASVMPHVEQGRLRGEIEHVTLLVHDWISWRSENDKPFDEWCAAHGRKYKWCRTYYYSAPNKSLNSTGNKPAS